MVFHPVICMLLDIKYDDLFAFCLLFLYITSIYYIKFILCYFSFGGSTSQYLLCVLLWVILRKLVQCQPTIVPNAWQHFSPRNPWRIDRYCVDAHCPYLANNTTSSSSLKFAWMLHEIPCWILNKWLDWMLNSSNPARIGFWTFDHRCMSCRRRLQCLRRKMAPNIWEKHP